MIRILEITCYQLSGLNTQSGKRKRHFHSDRLHRIQCTAFNRGDHQGLNFNHFTIFIRYSMQKLPPFPLLSALKLVEKSLVNSSFSPYRPKTVKFTAAELDYKGGYFFRSEDVAGFWNKHRVILSA